jgi:hypothetical protein
MRRFAGVAGGYAARAEEYRSPATMSCVHSVSRSPQATEDGQFCDDEYSLADSLTPANWRERAKLSLLGLCKYGHDLTN